MSCGEYFAGVRPSERGGGLVVKLHEGEHLVGEVVLACERPVLEEATGEDGEEDLHLVEPACVPGGEDEAPARVLGEPVCYLLGRPGREVVADRDHLLPFGDLACRFFGTHARAAPAFAAAPRRPLGRGPWPGSPSSRRARGRSPPRAGRGRGHRPRPPGRRSRGRARSSPTARTGAA